MILQHYSLFMELLCDWVLGRITSLCHANLKLFSPSGHKHKHVHMHSHTCSEIIRIKLNRQFTSTVLKKKNTLIYDLKKMRMLLNGRVPAVQSCYFIFILFASVKRKKKKKRNPLFSRSLAYQMFNMLLDWRQHIVNVNIYSFPSWHTEGTVCIHHSVVRIWCHKQKQVAWWDVELFDTKPRQNFYPLHWCFFNYKQEYRKKSVRNLCELLCARM